MGQLYLTNVDFLKNGIPASVMAALVCVTLLSSSSVDRTLIAGTIGGRIAWLCIDETYWVRVALSSLLSSRYVQGGLTSQRFGVLRPANAALEPR
jgi:hypothetical protein